jgi:hypothetical protein
MYMLLDKPDGFSVIDLENALKAMTNEAMQAEAKAYGLSEAVAQLKASLIREQLKEPNITEGDLCFIEYSNGTVIYKYCGTRYGKIEVKRIGSNKKPYKTSEFLDHTYANHLKKLEAK